MKPVIVAIAFNRHRSFTRLLRSLSAAKYPDQTTLVISIDGCGAADVLDIAKGYKWPFGEKKIIQHEDNLGADEHILSCGDLTEEYGSIIILEDDIVVSPYFYDFAASALEFYANDSRVAEVALYSPLIHLWTGKPFVPLADRSDIYFVQTGHSWGQMWTQPKWSAFRDWLNVKYDGKFDLPCLPGELSVWPDTWDKKLMKYVAENDLYAVIPRVAYCTNFCDAGAHYDRRTNSSQVPLVVGHRPASFALLKESRAVYDSFYEIEPRILADAHPKLAEHEFSVDLYGNKDPAKISAPYMLTTQAARSRVLSFGLQMRPREANVLFGIQGKDIALAKTEDVFRRGSYNKSAWHFRSRWQEYEYSYDHIKGSQMVAALLVKLFKRVGSTL